MAKEEGRQLTMSPPISSICSRSVDESRPYQMNIRLVVQRKARPMPWRRRGQGDKSPHGPPVRLVAGDLQTKRGHNQTNYCLEN